MRPLPSGMTNMTIRCKVMSAQAAPAEPIACHNVPMEKKKSREVKRPKINT